MKPANILISNRNYKIADFGMGKILSHISEKQKLTKLGTPAYLAPEVYF